MKQAVLLTMPLGDGFHAQLAERAEIIGPADVSEFRTIPADERGRVRAIVTPGTAPIDTASMELLPQLGIICCFGSGFEKIDVVAAHARGILVTHSPDANAASVADYAVALLLASLHHLCKAHEFVRAGGWTSFDAAKVPMSRGLTGRRVGVLGMGAIGGKIADRLAAFETEVGYHNRHRKNSRYRYFDTLLGLAEWADVLAIACRADESNRHLVNTEVLQALGPQGHVVNISRGSILDETALIDALSTGAIAGAGLDVFEGEPHIRPDLLAAPNVVFSPHIGGGTNEAFVAMSRMVFNNLDAFLRSGQAVNPVPA